MINFKASKIITPHFLQEKLNIQIIQLRPRYDSKGSSKFSDAGK
jgi:hypothetical protein